MARRLDQLPLELLLSIARYLSSQSDINALAQSNRTPYQSLQFFLCQHNVHHSQGSALLWAAQNGYTDLATKLLDAGLDISSFESPCEVEYNKDTAEDLSKVNPLLISAQSGHIEILRLLLSEDRPRQACSSAQLRTVLHWALRSHQEWLVELMIEHKAPLDPAGNDREAVSALGLAISCRYNSIIPRLLELGAQPGERECPDALEQAICTHQPLLVELLLKHHIQMNSDEGVCYAASRGDRALLQLLIDYGLDLGVYGGAALLFAIKGGHYKTTKLLLENGANPDLACDLNDPMANDGPLPCVSAIGFAIHFQRHDILKLLLDNGTLPGNSDLLFPERHSEETRRLLSDVPKEGLPRKEWLYNIVLWGADWFWDRQEKDPTFKMPLLTYTIDIGPSGEVLQGVPES